MRERGGRQSQDGSPPRGEAEGSVQGTEGWLPAWGSDRGCWGSGVSAERVEDPDPCHVLGEAQRRGGGWLWQ